MKQKKEKKTLRGNQNLEFGRNLSKLLNDQKLLMKIKQLCLEKHFTQYFIPIKTLQFYKIYK
jgi:hypothetical protein